ncbi:conjugal transfer protein TrbD [Tepidimonas charontis]|jgi:type IV secretion system protein VirB3|uniref:Type IV secretory pathway, VirB3-like protein n=1 Tax=Tepidimonas charontis TaxID=2267262 RepID=A0A554XH25_9BURK|nr:conjugal transfer protein TrbD [Tepidimonas charontis]TSE35137.1 Type IV secretory pathway, VirB3-like protein [Tepidimonas charontis]
MDAWEVPVHRSLVRPLLLLNGERELVMMLGIVAGTFIVSLFQLWAAITGAVLWFVGLFFLQRMAQKDPKLSKVYFRSLRYTRKRHIPSASTPFALPVEIREVK